MRRLVTALCAIALTGVCTITPLPTASAHSNELESSPAANEVVTVLPKDVVITFDEPLLDAGAAMAVTGPDGTVVSQEPPRVKGKTLSTALSTGLAGPSLAGTYLVAYRVVSQDGHAVKGTFEFSVDSGDQPAGTASVPASSLPSLSAVAEDSEVASPSAVAEDSEVASPSAVAGESAADSGSPTLTIVIVIAIVVIGAIATAALIRRRRD